MPHHMLFGSFLSFPSPFNLIEILEENSVFYMEGFFGVLFYIVYMF